MEALSTTPKKGQLTWPDAKPVQRFLLAGKKFGDHVAIPSDAHAESVHCGRFPINASLWFISRCLRYAATSTPSLYLSSVESSPSIVRPLREFC